MSRSTKPSSEAAPAHFSAATFKFQRELKRHNERAWFLANKERYERQLRDRDWLELERPTLADVGCYPFVAVLEEARLDPANWPRLGAWAGRVEALPGFVAMPRLPRA